MTNAICSQPRHVKNALLAAFALCTALGATATARADDVTGTVQSVIVGNVSGKELRLKLNGVSQFCADGSDKHIAHLDDNTPHYHSVLRVLMAAQIAGRSVTVRAVKDGAFCRIVHVML